MINLLESLTKTFGVCGKENKIRELIIEHIKEKVDNYSIDNLGNIICYKKGKKPSGKSKLLFTYMDTEGVIATNILANGMIEYASIGIDEPFNLYNQKIIFENSTIGKVISLDNKIEKDDFVKKSLIDIGSTSSDESKRKIGTLEFGSYYSEIIKQGNIVISNSLSRSGCLALIKTIEEIKEVKEDTYFSFITQGAVGNRNAHNVIKSIKPYEAIMVKTIIADNLCKNDIKLGEGAVVGVIDDNFFYSAKLRTQLCNTAKKNNIQHQLLISNINLNNYTENNLLFAETLVGSIYIPCRYEGALGEMISLKDLEETISLLKSFVNDLIDN